MPAAATHTQSRTWVNPAVRNRDLLRKLNEARRKLCKNSPIFYKDFDLEQHRLDIAGDCQQVFRRAAERRIAELAVRQQCRKFDGPRPITLINPAFRGRQFNGNRASVIALETIFSPLYAANRFHHAPYTTYPKEVAEWPSKAESKYEGDERISTDHLHGRFLPLPRMTGNDTVNWMQRTMIEPYPLEDYYPRYHPDPSSWQVECVLKTHFIEDLQVGPVSDEGAILISDDLMEEVNA